MAKHLTQPRQDWDTGAQIDIQLAPVVWHLTRLSLGLLEMIGQRRPQP
jgi:hypothetical protein